MKHNFFAFRLLAPDYPNYGSTYTSELTKAQVDTLTPATNADFTATLTYYIAERVGPNNTEASELYEMRAKTVDSGDLFRSCEAFIEDVRAKRAYMNNTPATTTTTTAAPTTTTTTV